MNPGGRTRNPTVHYNKSMTRSFRIVALFVAVAIMVAPVGATVCAGHCVQPRQQAAVKPASHCAAAMKGTLAEDASARVGPPPAQAQSASDCGLKPLAVIVKPGDDQGRQLDAQLPSLLHWVSAAERNMASAAQYDPSPPGPSSPHLTPLRI